MCISNTSLSGCSCLSVIFNQFIFQTEVAWKLVWHRLDKNRDLGDGLTYCCFWSFYDLCWQKYVISAVASPHNKQSLNHNNSIEQMDSKKCSYLARLLTSFLHFIWRFLCFHKVTATKEDKGDMMPLNGDQMKCLVNYGFLCVWILMSGKMLVDNLLRDKGLAMGSTAFSERSKAACNR